jgi:hypothetical protein
MIRGSGGGESQRTVVGIMERETMRRRLVVTDGTHAVIDKIGATVGDEAELEMVNAFENRPVSMVRQWERRDDLGLREGEHKDLDGGRHADG